MALYSGTLWGGFDIVAHCNQTAMATGCFQLESEESISILRSYSDMKHRFVWCEVVCVCV